MFCENCGSKLPDNANTCPNCGAKVKVESASYKELNETTGAQTNNATNFNETNNAGANFNTNNNAGANYNTTNNMNYNTGANNTNYNTGANSNMTYNNVTGRQEPYLAGHDKTAMALFSIFLGGFGVHNFIMGETRKGVIRIVFTLAVCGVGGIFGLVDFIKILSDTYVVDPEKYFF